jgi:hypothetical protein
MTTGSSIAALRADVLRAFGAAACPPESQIAPHACEECQQLSADLAGVEWTAMPDALIEDNPSGLALLSPEAYAYFLPGYILYALDHFSSQSLPAEMTVYSLAYNEPANEDMADWQRARLKFITGDQLAVLQRFLQLVEADPDFGDYVGREEVAAARLRLEQFWAERWTV